MEREKTCAVRDMEILIIWFWKMFCFVVFQLFQCYMILYLFIYLLIYFFLYLLLFLRVTEGFKIQVRIGKCIGLKPHIQFLWQNWRQHRIPNSNISKQVIGKYIRTFIPNLLCITEGMSPWCYGVCHGACPVLLRDHGPSGGDGS